MEEIKPIKVLIVDDCKLTVIGLKTTIKQFEGIDVIGIAENGKIAIEKVQELNPEIVLMDIGMPVMDGITATKEISGLDLETKIIMLTSHDGEENVIGALSAGAYSYCIKDTAPETLVEIIKNTYKGASWLDPRIAKIVLNNFKKEYVKNKESVLTEREIDILNLIAKGCSNAQISETLFISLNTVKTHIKNIFKKLEVEDRTQAVMEALKKDIILEN